MKSAAIFPRQNPFVTEGTGKGKLTRSLLKCATNGITLACRKKILKFHVISFAKKNAS